MQKIQALIQFGNRVTIRDRFGLERTGHAVMHSAEGGWVLSLGGRYGTPGLATDRNTVAIKGKRLQLRT